MTHQNHAILIGIEKLERLLGGRIRGCLNDVQELHRVLSYRGFRIDLLLDQLATRNTIVSAFNQLIDRVEAGDTVLIYFAGRGSWIQAKEWPHRCPTLVTYDSGRDGVGGPNRDILAPELTDWVKQLAARAADVAVIVDASNCGLDAVGGQSVSGGQPTNWAIRSALPDQRIEAAMGLDKGPQPVASSIIERLRAGVGNGAASEFGASMFNWLPSNVSSPENTASPGTPLPIGLILGNEPVASERPRQGITHGILSGALVDLLDADDRQHADEPISWRRIFAELTAKKPTPGTPLLTLLTHELPIGGVPTGEPPTGELPTGGLGNTPPRRENAPQPRATRRALLIGVNQYPNVPPEFGRPLKGAINDVQRLHTLLTRYGFQTRVLLNAYATRANIKAAMQELEGDAEHLQDLVLHFSGHGGRVVGQGWRRTFHTLVPYDSGRGQRDGKELVNRDVFDTEIDLWIRRLNLKAPNLRPILLFDSCYAGGVSRSGVKGRPGEPGRPGGQSQQDEERNRSLKLDDERATEAMFDEGRSPREVADTLAATDDTRSPGSAIARGATGWLPYADRQALVLAAAAEDEWATETRFTSKHGPSFNCGRFTYWLVSVLDEQPPVAWEELPWEIVTPDLICRVVRDSSDRQQPVVEGLHPAEPLPELVHHALIIGIDRYDEGRGIRSLKTPTADARALAEVLVSDQGYRPEHVHQLIDEQASSTAILETLEKLRTSDALGDASALLFYFAGHGQAESDGGQAEGTAEGDFEGFLLPWGADIDDQKTWLPMRQLRHQLNALDCRHQLVVLDCCFAGAFSFSRGVKPRKRLYRSQLQRYLQSTARQLLTSAAHNQLARDVSRRRTTSGRDHSPFAAALLDGLSGAADFVGDGIITTTELHQYIERELIGVAGGQNPVLARLAPGHDSQFIFRHPGQPPLPAEDPDIDTLESPWQGLEPYGEAHTRLFFGRQETIHHLLTVFEPEPSTASDVEPQNQNTPTLVAVVGASGSGTSSLVRAGLLPRLRQRPERWRIVELPRLTEHPEAQLTTALAEANRDGAMPKSCTRLLFIDQFEELFTQCPAATARQQLVDGLNRQLASGDRVVVTVRSDFHPHLLKAFGKRLQTVVVPRPNLEALREVIERPAQERGVYWEAGLPARIIEDVRDALVPLPLLSIALDQTYSRAWQRWLEQPDRELTAADYDGIGGVGGALRNRAEQLYAESDEHQQETLRRLFLRLASMEGKQPHRRRVEKRELVGLDAEPSTRTVLDRWIQGRFLVQDETCVEPASNALIQTWARVGQWLAASQPLVQVLRDLWRQAVAWEADGAKPESGLLWHDNPRLLQLRQQGRNRPELNTLEKRFVDASFEHYEDQLEAERKQRRYALASNLAFQSRDALDHHLDLALLLSAQAVRFNEDYQLPDQLEIRRSLLRAVSHHSDLTHYLHGHAQPVEAIAWSADEQLLASAGRDGSIVLWDLATRQPYGELLAERREPIWALAFNPVDSWLLAATHHREILCWDTRSGRLHQRLAGHQDIVLGLAWSPDGATLASTGRDGTIGLWERSGKPRTWLQNPGSGAAVALAFRPDSRHLATGAGNGRIHTWDVISGSPIAHWQAHEQRVSSLAWRPWPDHPQDDRGELLASSSGDGVRLWEPDSTEQITWFRGHSGWVADVTWSPDGKLLASASADSEIFLWQEVEQDNWDNSRLVGHDGAVSGLAFSSGGAILASAGWDHSVILWSPLGAPPLLRHWRSVGQPVIAISLLPTTGLPTADLLPTTELSLALATASPEPVVLIDDTLQQLSPGHAAEHSVRSVAVSPTGDLLASGGSDGVILLWDLVQRQLLQRFEFHPGPIEDLAFSPDGAYLASSCEQDRVMVLRLASGEAGSIATGETPTGIAWSPSGLLAVALAQGEILIAEPTGHARHRFRAHDSDIADLAFSPNGSALATAGRDGRVLLWSAEMTIHRSFSGHRGNLTRLAWSPDGGMLATCGVDGTVRLWDTTTGANLGAPLVGHKEVFDLAWTADGQTLVSADLEGRVLFWAVDLDSWLQSAQGRANRNLSREEWDRFVGADIPYQRTFPDLPVGHSAEA